MSGMLAAIDCGSNSIRLLVVDEQEHVLARGLRVTRLGEGVDASGILEDAAIARTVDAIATFVTDARRLGADRIRIIATSAVRDARDRDRFLDAVTERTGERPDLLAGDDEARLSFAGATSDQPTDERLAMVDIGGGSTELVVGCDRLPERFISTQIGCVRHTERFEVSGVVAPDRLAEMDAFFVDAFATAVEGWPKPVRLIGVAGTVTSLAAIDLGLRAYDPDRVHGHVFARDRVERMRAELAAIEPGRRLARYPILSPGREDVIVAGSSILLAAMAAFAVDEVTASEREILHGVIQDLRGTDRRDR